MKKLSLLLLLSVAVLFAGCSDSDDWENLTNHPIVGSWQLEKCSFDFVTNNQEFTDAMTVMVNEMVDEILGEIVTFNPDGTAVSIVEGEVVSVKYRIKGTTLVYDIPGEGRSESTFSMVNDQLILIDNLKPMLEKEVSGSGIKIEKAILRQVAKRVN